MVFDLSDPGVKKMVDSWADNTEYEATVTVRTGAGPQRNVAEVTSFQPEEGMEESEPEEPSAKPAPSKPPKAKPAVNVEY